jgi:hypothetical protein
LALSFRLPFLPSYIIPLIPSIITSALKMETAGFSKTLAFTNQSTWRLNPEEHHHYCHHHENLKSNIHPDSMNRELASKLIFLWDCCFNANR